MQTNGSLDQPVGRFDALLDWWLLLRGALDGRAPHTKGAIDLVDADGAPLALDRSFTADAPLDEMGDFLQRAGYLHLDGCVHRGRDGRGVAPTWTPPRPRTRAATAGRGGRATAAATTCSCACSTSTRCRPRSSGWSPTSGCSGSPTSPATATSTATMEGQPHRGAVQAVRRGRGHLRPAVAQGLRARSPQLRLLQHDRRHLGHRRRRGVGSAARGRRFAPRAHVAVVARREPLRPADGPAAHAHRRRHRAPVVHAAPVAAAGRARAPGACTPGSGSRHAAPTPNAPRSERLRAIREDAPVKAPSANRA